MKAQETLIGERILPVLHSNPSKDACSNRKPILCVAAATACALGTSPILRKRDLPEVRQAGIFFALKETRKPQGTKYALLALEYDRLSK